MYFQPDSNKIVSDDADIDGYFTDDASWVMDVLLKTVTAVSDVVIVWVALDTNALIEIKDFFSDEK